MLLVGRRIEATDAIGLGIVQRIQARCALAPPVHLTQQRETLAAKCCQLRRRGGRELKRCLRFAYP